MAVGGLRAGGGVGPVLEQRLADLSRGGLTGTEQAGYGLWEETAARMVDAQASGLASRVRELGSGWPERVR